MREKKIKRRRKCKEIGVIKVGIEREGKITGEQRRVRGKRKGHIRRVNEEVNKGIRESMK